LNLFIGIKDDNQIETVRLIPGIITIIDRVERTKEEERQKEKLNESNTTKNCDYNSI